MSLSNTIAINPQHLSDLMSEQAFFANIRIDDSGDDSAIRY
ncbi:hypothetical protein [Moraxella ovis]|nr:hypothetical protein [Moraxella ovis]SPX84311.1 Uncharacterised protein [Moraxella ovis]